MAYDNRDNIDFGKEKIPKLFSSIFIPTLLGMVADVAFILTDGVFVGHGIGPDGLASVNLACPAMLLITGLGVMFGMGGSIVGAIHLSHDNVKAARINITQAMLTSIFLAVVVVSLLYAFPARILSLLGVSPDLMDLALEYFYWFIPMCFFLMILIVGSFFIRLDGSPKYSMFATVVPSIINIILDYIFIFPCEMGLAGAALATDIGTFTGAAMVIYYCLFKANRLSFYKLKWTFTSLRLGARNVCHMIRLGFSGFIGEFATSVIILAGNLSFGKYIGDIGIAAYSVICYIFPVVINIYLAVSSSAQPILSYNHGAKSEERVSDTYRFSIIISMAFSGIVTILFWIFAPVIISAFLNEGMNGGAAAYDLAVKGLPLFALGFLPMAFNLTSIGYFQSIEQSAVSVLLTLLRGFILVATAFLLMPKFLGENGLWLAVPVSETITAVVGLCFLMRRK